MTKNIDDRTAAANYKKLAPITYKGSDHSAISTNAETDFGKLLNRSGAVTPLSSTIKKMHFIYS